MDVPVAELLQITREYVQQIKDADDTDLAIPRTLVANIEGAAKEAQQELDGKLSYSVIYGLSLKLLYRARNENSRS